MPATERQQQSAIYVRFRAATLRLRAAVLVLPLVTIASGAWCADRAAPLDIDRLVKSYASAYAVPLDLARRLIKRESGFNPSAKHNGNLGLMQIRAATARGLGYTGPPEGLLVAETNLAYGMAYLANALMVARGDGRRAERFFQTGFYYEAKRTRLLAQMIKGCEFKVQAGVSCATPAPTDIIEARIGDPKIGDPASGEPVVAGPKVAQPIVAEASIVDIAIPVRKPVLLGSAELKTTALGYAAPDAPQNAAPKMLGAVILDTRLVTPGAVDPIVTASVADPLPPLPRARPILITRMALPRARPSPTAISQLEAPR